MKLRLDLELSKSNILALCRLALVMGWRPSGFAKGHVRAPHSEWTEREQRDACRYALARLVPAHEPIPIDDAMQRSASSEPSAEHSKRQTGARRSGTRQTRS